MTIFLCDSFVKSHIDSAKVTNTYYTMNIAIRFIFQRKNPPVLIKYRRIITHYCRGSSFSGNKKYEMTPLTTTAPIVIYRRVCSGTSVKFLLNINQLAQTTIIIIRIKNSKPLKQFTHTE